MLNDISQQARTANNGLLIRLKILAQLTEVQSGNSATCTLDGFMEMARFTISFEEAKAFKASRNQGIRKNEWHDLTVAVGIRTKT